METRCVLQSVYVWLPQTMTWLYGQVQNLQGWQSVVLCQKTANLDQFPWPNIWCLRDKGTLLYVAHKVGRALGIRRHPALFERVAQDSGALVLHSHFGPQGWKDMWLAQKHKLAHVVTFYGFDVGMLPRRSQVWLRRYREMFMAVDAVLCEGPHMASCIEELGCPSEKLRVHHLGVDLERLHFHPREWQSGGPLRLMCASAFHEKKGLPYAVEGVGILLREHPDLEVELTIIGDSTGEPRSEGVKERINALIKEYNLENSVRMLGFMPYQRMLEEAYRHHLLIAPSVTASDGDTEGGAPVSIIELAASGMPVVSTSHCDIPYVLGELNRALLVPERDSTALAAAIWALVERQERWYEIAKCNREHIEQEFSVVTQGLRLGAVYDEVTQATPR